MNQGEPRSCPALLIAAPASGQGKTTVAVGLARLHARQGRKVRVFKCGPDFIDPGWLALASGAPVHSLDLWMTGENECAQQLWVAAGEADLLIIEGVMGLFDGKPSAADLARRFGLPVVGVIDAGAMAGTFGALAFGLEHYQSGLRWAGVLANRVAGATHAAMLRDALADPQNWLGALHDDAALALPERHLGLVTIQDASDPQARIDAMADALAVTPLGQLTPAQLQRWSVRFEAPPAAVPVQPLLQGTTVAIARDAAFCFIYPANLDCLRSLGAQLAFFSPLAGEPLPACDAVWLPGGYPELHAARLAGNHAVRDSLRAHVGRDRPVWAECGGMMVLFEQLRTAGGECHQLWGLLAGTVTMRQRLAGLGPQQLALGSDVLRGHTFHYSSCESPLAVRTRTSSPGAGSREGEALFELGALRASYFHAWFPSSPPAVARLFTSQGVDA